MLSKVFGHVIFFTVNRKLGIGNDVHNSTAYGSESHRVGFVVCEIVTVFDIFAHFYKFLEAFAVIIEQLMLCVVIMVQHFVIPVFS